MFKKENFNVVKILIGEHKLIINYSSNGTDGLRDYKKIAKWLELKNDFKTDENYTLPPMIRGNLVYMFGTKKYRVKYNNF